MGIGVGLLIVAILIVGGVAILERKTRDDEKKETVEVSTQKTEEKSGNETQVITEKPESPAAYQPNKQSEVVSAIAGIALIVSIIASIICFVACANEHNDTLQIVLGILGGYVLLQGLILFGVLYGIGHILRHNEEMDETTKGISETNKAISEKMDKIIEKL